MASGDHSTPVNQQGKTLEVCELFHSIAGESSRSGTPALFVRLAGCNLRCAWCDTKKSWEKGQVIPLETLVGVLTGKSTRLVVITGGEPLLQPAVADLCHELIDAGKRVQMETNGSLDISVLPKEVQIVMDIKPPSSKEFEKMDLDNLHRLRAGDDLKMVIAGRDDFSWAEKFMREHAIPDKVEVFLSPATGLVEACDLADWILDSDLDVRLQLQIHKLIWSGEQDGRPLDLLAQQ